MEINNHEYQLNENGVLCQVNPNVPENLYDFNYVMDRYGNISDKRLAMSHLRYGFMVGAIGKPTKLLEIGYGAGDFLKVCEREEIECLGNDITGIPTPQNVAFTNDIYEHVDVVCMFDVLEHFEDINFIKDLNTKFVYVSVPNCHLPEDEIYLELVYPHLRPNEHLFHFNMFSLKKHFHSNGYSLLQMGFPEDTIRKRQGYFNNILSAIFVKE
jgi:hypothetical protein